MDYNNIVLVILLTTALGVLIGTLIDLKNLDRANEIRKQRNKRKPLDRFP